VTELLVNERYRRALHFEHTTFPALRKESSECELLDVHNAVLPAGAEHGWLF